MIEIPFPKYHTEPGFAGSVTDMIVRDCDYVDREHRRIGFISCYQGETDYEPLRGHGESRLTFRWGKLPWRWGWLKEGERYWNFDCEADFQKSVNGSWGILEQGGEPVDAETLAVFRAECYGLAVTGWYDYATQLWRCCEPTTERPHNASFVRLPSTLEFAHEHNLPQLIRECELALA